MATTEVNETLEILRKQGIVMPPAGASSEEIRAVRRRVPGLTPPLAEIELMLMNLEVNAFLRERGLV